MTLDDVCASFDRLDFPGFEERAHPERATVREARAQIQVALKEPAFLRDCFTHELLLIESGAQRCGLAPFLVTRKLGVRFAFGYWPPGGGVPPHEHTAWTITAVCRNQLDVTTFDRAESYRRGELVRKNLFSATAGEVGCIFEPAIHAPQNNSSDWTLSLHVSSPRDGEPLPGIEPLPGLELAVPCSDVDGPYHQVLRARERQCFVRLLVRCLAADRSQEARALLLTAYPLADSRTRRSINERLPLHERQPNAVPTSLKRTHHLELRVERSGERCTLVASTPHGRLVQLTANAFAHDALAFAVTRPRFNVHDLPGLSSDEQIDIAEVLEETGLFQRAAANT
jgi:hypothetical protein